MTDDIAELYERAAREMRPAFVRELREMVVDIDSLDGVVRRSDDHDMIAHAGPMPPSEHGPRWSRPMMMIAAATVVVAAGMVLVPRNGGNEVPSAPRESSTCASQAEQLGVVSTATIDVQVGIMPDGHTFCLVDDGDASSLGSEPNADLLVNASTGGGPPTEAALVEQGTVPLTAYWYVIAIPDGMPVASAATEGGPLASFPSRTGRRLLVVDSDVDLRQTDGATRHVNLFSASGVVLTTIVVPIAPASEPSPGEGPP